MDQLVRILHFAAYIIKLHYLFSSLLYACLGLICLTPMFCSLPRHSWRILINRRDHASFRLATPIVRGCLWVSTPTEPKDLETVTPFSGSICCRSHQFTSRVMCTFWDLTAECMLFLLPESNVTKRGFRGKRTAKSFKYLLHIADRRSNGRGIQSPVAVRGSVEGPNRGQCPCFLVKSQQTYIVVMIFNYFAQSKSVYMWGNLRRGLKES